MLLGFKRQFAPFVLDGSKTHTIRSPRKIAPKVGEPCHCYVDPRQESMRLLGRWPCVKVEQIRIEGGWEACSGEFFGAIHIGDHRLDPDEENLLAWHDGFRSSEPAAGASLDTYRDAFTVMIEFWRGRLPFKGQIIHWDYSRPLVWLPNPIRNPLPTGATYGR